MPSSAPSTLPVTRGGVTSRHGRPGRLRSLLVAVLALVAMGGVALPVQGAEGGAPVMEASVLLEGHARVGAWMAIQVNIRNDGPSIVGELRLAAGREGRTRFGTTVDLPTQSDKAYLLYAQPPAFGGNLDVALVTGNQTIATQEVAFTVHDTTQLVVGVVAEQPQGIVPKLDLLPSPNGTRAAVVPLGLEDLPERVEAWATLDRLIWQDADSSQLSENQIAAMRGWLAAGGRLVIAGGTAGGSVLSGFPDDILPYRPIATTEVAAASLSSLLGEIPADVPDVLALSGELARGRPLATVGDQVVAADVGYGTGNVTLLGFDPATGWIGDLDGVESLWRRFLPPRSAGPVIVGDDGQLVNAVSQLPALALPPIGGLLALLIGYILLIGPINYLVLRKLDRREWAWITMPILIAVFAAGAYGYGAALRGLDVIVNEVAVVQGAPDATEGTAQVYLGVFSPSRGTYQVEVPGGALLTSTLTGDFVGGNAGALDVLQGNPARIRDLVVGFGSLRTVRAETAATVPRIQADLRLEAGTLKGTVRNLSEQPLEKPAVVLGGSVVVLKDLAPGSSQDVSLPVRTNAFGQSLSERILGAAFFGDPNRTSESTQRSIVRRAVIDQLTFDPQFQSTGVLPSESPVLLAWGSGQVLDVRVSGQLPRRTGNVLYYIPLPMTVRGATVFEGDLMRSSLIESDAAFFNKTPFSIDMARGTATLAYRPIPFEGSLTATKVVVAMNFGDVGIGAGNETLQPADPQPCRDDPTDEPDCVDPEPPDCDPNTEDCFNQGFDGTPSVELFDRSAGGKWIRMSKIGLGKSYALAEPERYVDPGSGTLLVRFVNDLQDGLSFNFQVRIEGDVR